MKQFCHKGHDTSITGRDRKSMCNICKKEYGVQYRQDHLEQQREISKRYRDRYRGRYTAKLKLWREKHRLVRYQYLAEVKAKPCKDCGLSFHPICMDFDHKDPNLKINSIAHMAWSNVGLERIKAEIVKCDLVCANCHRLRTYNQFSSKTYALYK